MTNTASQLCPTARLSKPARQRAVDFILQYGTNLQRERYLYRFQESPSNLNVLASLPHYQNSDGGFGHGLEADLRTRHSSVIATTIAMQILVSVDAGSSKLASDALNYFIDEYHCQNWSAINIRCNDAPHAPWWKYNPDTNSDKSFVANPGAEIISYLIGHHAMGAEIPVLLDRAISHLAGNDLEMHELMCYTRLFENPDLDEKYKREMLPYLLSNSYRLVKVKEQDWEEYCLTPLTMISHPDSIYTDFFSDVLEQNFVFRINRQNDDGSWSPNWSWGVSLLLRGKASKQRSRSS
ncbi:MAG: hypothetical protein ABGY96_20030 [bacterium]|nr:hypothetical protein [Gammaproteobacteria bacterium]HIL97955.1 hypothetical protein [Pseudomonadales bacterium]